MQNKRTYHPFFAGLLVALYAFVATPVQLWHHHNYPAVVSKHSDGKKQLPKISESNADFNDGSCSVCSHQYSTYTPAEIAVTDAPLIPATARAGVYFSSFLLTPSSRHLNKGPPALL